MSGETEEEPRLGSLEVLGVYEDLRYSFFQLAVVIALGFVLIAAMLSVTREGSNALTAALATGLMAAPLLLTLFRCEQAWEEHVDPKPQWTLLIAPVFVIIAVLDDRSAFIYPGLAWVAVAALAGGPWHATACVLALTLASSLGGLITSQLTPEDALLELLVAAPHRLLLALGFSALARELTEITWQRAEDAYRYPQPARTRHGGWVDTDEVPAGPPERPLPGSILLSAEQKAVVTCLASGMTLNESADALGLSLRAARGRRDRAAEKAEVILNRERSPDDHQIITVRTTRELIDWAISSRVVALPAPASIGDDSGPSDEGEDLQLTPAR